MLVGTAYLGTVSPNRQIHDSFYDNAFDDGLIPANLFFIRLADSHPGMNLRRVLSIAMQVITGVCLATLGDYDYTLLGLTLTISGTILSALKGIFTNKMQLGSLKLHPLDLLLHMSFYALLQTITVSFFTGELKDAIEFIHDGLSNGLLFVLAFNGMLAFFLNVASFIANRQTNALTMSIAGVSLS